MNRKTKRCSQCERAITTNNYKRHIQSCGKEKDRLKIDEQWKLSSNVYQCPYCQEEYSRKGIATHIWRKHTEKGKEHKTVNNLLDENGSTWNNGLTAQTDARVKKNTKATTKALREKVRNGTYKVIVMSPEARKRLSIRQSLNNSGGKCKWYTVNNKKVQGTWERDVAIKMTNFGIVWDRIYNVIPYTLNGKNKSYTPDFILPKENLILEIKGYWWGNDKEKMKVISLQNKAEATKILLIKKKEYDKLLLCNSKKDFLLMLRKCNNLKEYFNNGTLV